MPVSRLDGRRTSHPASTTPTHRPHVGRDRVSSLLAPFGKFCGRVARSSAHTLSPLVAVDVHQLDVGSPACGATAS